MSIRVAKIDACAAMGPGEVAFHRNAVLRETRLPCRQALARNAESDVRLAVASVRRDIAEGQNRAVRIAAATEQNQNLPLADAERAEAIVGFHDGVAEKPGVEITGAIKIRHAETSLQNGTWQIRGTIRCNGVCNHSLHVVRACRNNKFSQPSFRKRRIPVGILILSTAVLRRRCSKAPARPRA